jgi:hypothetical protein
MGLTVFYGIFSTFKLNIRNIRIFRGILSAPQNIIMDLNNVMNELSLQNITLGSSLQKTKSTNKGQA